MRRLVLASGALTLLAASSLWALAAADWSFKGLWLTPDQQGRLLWEAGRYDEAAAAFAEPQRRAEALYRAKRFKEAAAAFGRLDRPEAFYDRGNALVLSGDYAGAIASYQKALTVRPEWPEALQNLAIAQVRKQRLDESGADAAEEGTDGALRPDSVTFDAKAKEAPADQTEQTAGGAAEADSQLRSLWLQRVQTKPADFLRSKFAFQQAAAQAGGPAP